MNRDMEPVEAVVEDEPDPSWSGCDCYHCWDPAYAAEAAMAWAQIEQHDTEARGR